MDPLYIILPLVLAAVALLSQRAEGRAARVWKQAPGVLNLSRVGSRILRGTRDGVEIVARGGLASNRADRVSAMVATTGASTLPGGINVRWEGNFAKLSKAMGRPDQDVGDPTFDAQFMVTGDPSVVPAMFDTPTREALRELASPYLEVRDGAVVWNLYVEPRSTDELVDACAKVTQVAKLLRLGDTSAVKARLLREVREGSAAVAAARCLDVLARDYPAQGETRAAIESALRSGFAPVRLAAIGYHAASLEPPALEAFLVDALGVASHPDVRAALASIAGERQVTGARRAVEALLDGPKDDPSVRAAVDALAVIGNVESVEALRRVSRLWLAPGLVTAAQRTIAQIQSGLEGAEGGRLALVDETGVEGGLSHVREEGALSVEDD